MLKKITEPQAVYQKAHQDGVTPSTPVVHPTMPPSQSSKPPKAKFNTKIITSVLAVSLFAVVAVAGVLVAQRQQNQPGPVAPNAPESQPQAAIEQFCSLGFEVAPPPTGLAECVSKTAVKVEGTKRTTLAANAKVNPGDTIEYTITIGTKSDTTRVDIRDAFPTAYLDYVGGSAKLDGATLAVDANEIKKNILVAGYDVPAASRGKQNKVTYQVKVKQGLTGGEFFNHADIKFNNVASTTDSCEMNLGIQPPVASPKPSPSPSPLPTGVAACETKLAYSPTGAQYAQNDVVTRGTVLEYKVKVSAEKTTSGAVVVTDKVPTALQVDANSILVDGAKVTGANYNAATSTITVPLGVMAPTNKKQTKVLSYKATVKADATPTSTFSNAVIVSTNGKAATTPATCKSTLKVAAVGVAQCVDKTAFTDYSGTAIAHEASIQRGQTIAYKLKITAAETTTGKVVVTDKLPDSLEFVEVKTQGVTFDANTRTLTADFGVMGDTAANREKIVEFKVKVKSDANPGDITNTANVTTAGGSIDPCLHTVRVPYICNSTCLTDSQCQSGNQSYVCSASNGNRCRLDTNTTSAECTPPDTTYSCNSSCETDDQCKSHNSDYKCAETSQGKRCRLSTNETNASCETLATPTPTPAIGCNATCATNADCTNPAHICYSTEDGSQRCRLDTNPQSASCSSPTASTPVQPDMPEELPQSGPENWVNWLKAGLITLGIGAILLLLL